MNNNLNQNNNSSNKNFIITIIVVVILIALASGGAIYLITSNRNNNQPNQENNNEQPSTPTPVTLSDEELAKYLRYIPIGAISAYDSDKSAYKYEKITVNDYNKKVLIHHAINQAENFGTSLKYENKACGATCPELNGFGGYYDIAYDLTPLKKSLHAMYNLSLESLDLNVLNENSLGSYSGESYEYFDGGIVVWQGMGSLYGTNVLDRYEANTNELTIYSYRVIYNFNSPIVNDAYTRKEFTITDDYETYVENHKDEFTQYKSVFKKNDTGYYWYSTEIVK